MSKHQFWRFLAFGVGLGFVFAGFAVEVAGAQPHQMATAGAILVVIAHLLRKDPTP